MANRPKKTRKSQSKVQELVVVAFVDDLEQAKDYEALLQAGDVPTVVREQDETSLDGTKSYAVMVPEEFLDEASVIIESHDDYDDFPDFELEDEDVDDSEDDFYNYDFQN